MKEEKIIDIGCMKLSVKRENDANILVAEIRDACVAVSDDVKQKFGEMLKEMIKKFDVKRIIVVNGEGKNGDG